MAGFPMYYCANCGRQIIKVKKTWWHTVMLPRELHLYKFCGVGKWATPPKRSMND